LQYVGTGEISEQAFIDMATKFGVSSIVIRDAAKIMSSDLDDATKKREIEVAMNLDEVRRDATTLEELMGTVTRDRNVNVYTLYKKEGGPVGFAGGGIVGYADGGIAGLASSIASRVQVPSFDTGGVLAMLHPPEVVLNGKQALRAIWNMANMPMQNKTEAGIKNTFNITSPEPLTESELRRQIDMVSRKMGYRIGL